MHLTQLLQTGIVLKSMSLLWKKKALLSRDIGGASFDIVVKICKKLEIDPLEV